MVFSGITEHNAVFIGVLLFAVGLWMYFGNRRRARNVTLSALLMVGGYWSFAHILWRMADTPDQGIFWLRTLVFISSLLPTFFLFYVLSLFRGRMPALFFQLLALLTNVAVFWLTYLTSAVARVESGHLVFGPGLLLVGLQFGVLYLVGLLALLLVSRLQSADGRPRGRTNLITFAGSVVSFNAVFAVLVGAASPHDPWAFWAANLALAVGLLLMATPAVGRRMVNDLRMVGGELFVLTLVTLIIADLVITESMLDFAFRLVLLNVFVVYGVITLRTLSKEVRRLSQVEKLTEQVTRMNRQLIEADRIKMRFLSFASHQLRAPLSGVYSYLTMLEDGSLGRVTKKQKEVLQANLEAVERMRNTIETFLDVSKIEMGKLKLDLEKVRIDLLVGDVVRDIRSKAEEKGLELDLTVDGPVPEIMADSGKLYHVLLNIIDNAIKYTDQGSVKVSVGTDDGCVTVTVNDTGRGLSEEKLEAVRRLLVRGLEEIKFKRDGGSGLGIHIARKIVGSHGGRMEVYSSGEGRGTSFTVRLPKSGHC